jgi:hypothetical protein
MSSKLFRRAAATVVAAAALAATMAGPASAAVSTTGSPGAWLSANPGWNVCYESLNWIEPTAITVGRSPSYASSNQTVYFQTTLQSTRDGYTWSDASWTGFSNVTLRPGQTATHDPATFQGLSSGFGFRIKIKVYWYVGSTEIGTRTIVFDHGADYYGNTFSGGCVV